MNIWNIIKFLLDTAAYVSLGIIITTFIYVRLGNEVTLSWKEDENDFYN